VSPSTSATSLSRASLVKKFCDFPRVTEEYLKNDFNSIDVVEMQNLMKRYFAFQASLASAAVQVSEGMVE
jgi:hypothetical protein